MERKSEAAGLDSILGGEFVELDELERPGGRVRAVRVAVRSALEAARLECSASAEYVNRETNTVTNTNTGPAALVGGSAVSGENMVDIEPQNLAAEAAAVEIPDQPGAPPAPAPGGEGAGAIAAAELTMEQLQSKVPAWKPGTDLIANTLADVIAPNWRVTREERDQVSGAFALALAAWFPDDVIPIKYLVLMNVGASIWNLAATRRDPNTGKFIPLRLAPPPDSAKTATPAAPAPSGPASTSTGSGATTSA